MRKIFCTLLFTVLIATASTAQFYKSFLPSPEFNSALEKIVLDFRFNYKNIQGDSLVKDGGTETFESSVKIPGATNCVISYFNSRIDTTASWQAIMYTGENYKEAARAYQNVYRLVKKSRVNWIDHTSFGFTGDLEEPREELKFAVSRLKFDFEDRRYKNFEAEIELVNNYNNWEVHLNLQKRKADDEKY
jgi:hypothetical protein